MVGRLESLSSRYGIELPTEKVKPWGYTIGIPSESVHTFIEKFFSGEAVGTNPSPRFLVVNPHSRLSWQSHQRRSELWRVVKGPVGIMLSTTDNQPQAFTTLNEGDLVKIEPNIRHRLIGINHEGVVAEVWIHIDPKNPSDASDIIRLADDYSR